MSGEGRLRWQLIWKLASLFTLKHSLLWRIERESHLSWGCWLTEKIYVAALRLYACSIFNFLWPSSQRFHSWGFYFFPHFWLSPRLSHLPISSGSCLPLTLLYLFLPTTVDNAKCMRGRVQKKSLQSITNLTCEPGSHIYLPHWNTHTDGSGQSQVLCVSAAVYVSYTTITGS